MPRVSVIVPVHRPTNAFRRCVREVLALDGSAHELVIVSDQPIEGLPAAVKLVVTGSPTDTSPAEKRDAGAAVAAGDILAFLDDDAYPARDWLVRALVRFADAGVAAVGGPGLTPEGSSFRERAGGAFYESPFGSGQLRARFRPLGSVRPVDDWPAFNFLVRREALAAVGGWGSTFYGGEDTKVCLELREAGFEIVYDPDVIVYHYRRPIFGPHIRQVANVGRHRGYFVRAFPRTSARPIYFAPSVATVVAGLWTAVALGRRRPRIALLLAAAGVSATIAGKARRDGHEVDVAAALPAVVFASHIAYAAEFLRGLLTPRLTR
jgi:GT2 family glycosyltransferase